MTKKELLLRKYVQIYRPLLQKEAKKEFKRKLTAESEPSINIAA